MSFQCSINVVSGSIDFTASATASRHGLLHPCTCQESGATTVSIMQVGKKKSANRLELGAARPDSYPEPSGT